KGPQESTAVTVEDAVQAADKIGYPVVLKILSPDIQHKTEIGGVKVNLANAREVTDAFLKVMQSAKTHYPNAKIDGVVVQEMISQDSVEVILGIVKDADFGPVVVYG